MSYYNEVLKAFNKATTSLYTLQKLMHKVPDEPITDEMRLELSNALDKFKIVLRSFTNNGKE